MPRFLRGRTMTNAWREPGEAVSLEDAAVAGRLAREAANPFGRKLAARDLLARFGGDTPDGRRRARAALQLAGVAAEPSIDTAQPHQFVALHPAAPTVAQAEAAGDDTAVVTVVAPRRRVAIGALGLLGLAVVLVVAMLMRGMAGSGDEDAALALSSDTTPTVTVPSTPTTPATTPTTPRPAPRSPAAARPRRRPRVRPAPAPAPRRVRLLIAPTELSYVCVAEDDGTPIFNGMLETPFEVTRAHVRFRIGVGTARITANGRDVPVNVAPSGFRVGPRATRMLPPNDPVCR